MSNNNKNNNKVSHKCIKYNKSKKNIYIWSTTIYLAKIIKEKVSHMFLFFWFIHTVTYLSFFILRHRYFPQLSMHIIITKRYDKFEIITT
jgi:hypothetical protein